MQAYFCGLFGYTRQAYCKQLNKNTRKALDEGFIISQVRLIRKDMPRLGGKKLHCLLKEKGIDIGRDILYDILRNNKMLVKKKKKYAITTNSKHWMKKYPNLIRGFNFTQTNQLWVSDITYIPINNGFVYLSLITDVYSHLIVGYRLSQTLERDGAVGALTMALKHIPGEDRIGLIHHSDRGVQYCSQEYVNLLKENNIRISMTENGDPYQNAVAERINGILKDEWLDHEYFFCFEDVKLRIDEIISI
ncbi:IS3 family transposase [Dysgonomonas sp. Marseille-P4677]|uniref:IS3 family transposase n=1 Tax=Dysgonomonas sp. Marseille-P4677 TaxID=2364790 RepID=UPI0019112DA0|nr:IS3 family transposase [Dysgonomonas sp. Marseille-P4677]MBK5722130.1 IS3 family transposase [Dysgonomonas sp. Marseille-P4677]